MATRKYLTLDGIKEFWTKLKQYVQASHVKHYPVVTTQTYTGTNSFTLPFSYYSDDILEVYCLGEKLIEGGHYTRTTLGAGATSNQIKWNIGSQVMPKGTFLEFVVKHY